MLENGEKLNKSLEKSQNLSIKFTLCMKYEANAAIKRLNVTTFSIAYMCDQKIEKTVAPLRETWEPFRCRAERGG